MLFLRVSSVLRSSLYRQMSTGIRETNIVTTNYLEGSDKGIVIIDMSSHKKKNTLGYDFIKSFDSAVDNISKDTSARVVILRSLVPKVFCAGADLKERLAMPNSEIKRFVVGLRNLMLKVENIPIPVISAIDGVALGGGLELALACDIRIASTSAKLGLVETRIAILPGAGGTQRLPRLIGHSLAKELIFTARVLNGKQAKEYGIVNHCTEDNEENNSAFLKAIEIAREILPNGPIGVKLAKVAVNKGYEVDIHQGCTIEELCYDQVIPTNDRIEGLRAFVEKRKPVYSGN